MNRSPLDLLPGFLRRRRPEEDIHDFLGVVELDTEPGMGVLVLPEHVAAVLEVSGTDYAYADPALRSEIVEGWASVLNSAGISLQVFILRRPMLWTAPGGFLDLMRRQVEADLHSDWQTRRLQRMEDAILRGELDGYPAMELRQYAVLRHAVGTLENRRIGNGEASMYIPPNRARFWDKPATLFGQGETGLAEWRKRREEAIGALSLVVERFLRDLPAVPGMSAKPLGGLELAQLLHLLWREEDALDEWIGDDETLAAIRSGAMGSDWLNPVRTAHDEPAVVADPPEGALRRARED